MTADTESSTRQVCEAVLAYLLDCQDFTAGEYYGSFWSEKAYHGPLLDYHGGGAHHNRGAGSAGLALWLLGKQRDDRDLMRRSELSFDWLASRQQASGSFLEIQNNEKPSDWEHTGLEEGSTIATGFAIHGLATALLRGLPPKKAYMDCLMKAAHWLLSIEWPPGSGIFPHHQRSPYDTLNANLHAAEALALTYAALEKAYGRRLDICFQGARRGVLHTLSLQWPDGCFPYRAEGNTTINYTSLVVWLLLNILDDLPDEVRARFAPSEEVDAALKRAAAFLCGCIDPEGALCWGGNEFSTSRHNVWAYVITRNVLGRIGGETNLAAAEKLSDGIMKLRTQSGLLPMRDRGEEITRCAYMQADMLLFLLPFA